MPLMRVPRLRRMHIHKPVKSSRINTICDLHGGSVNDTEQNLLALFRKLTEQDAQALLRFAAFLANEPSTTAIDSGGTAEAPTDAAIPQPELLERPENERVADALKRLSASYPMLDKKHLLGKASELVAQHVMFGKPANIVIDEIEIIFEQAYDKFVQDTRKR